MVSHIRLGQRDVLGHALLHGLVSADPLVGRAGRQDVRAARDRVPRDARAVHAPEVAHARGERDEHVRLHHALPERHRLLSRQDAHEIHALRPEHRDGARQ